MIPWLTLAVGLVSLAVVLVLAWRLRPLTEEAQETYAIGFRYTPQEDPDEDDGEHPGDYGC